MKESDVITKVDADFDVIKGVVETVVSQALEDYLKEAPHVVEVPELAAFLDEKLRQDGIAMKFAWLWSRANTYIRS